MTRVLILETSSTLRRIIASMLQQLGYTDIIQVEVASDIQNFNEFDIIVADSKSISTLKSVVQRCIIIICDTKTEAELPAGFLYVEKPFSADFLASRIAALPDRRF